MPPVETSAFPLERTAEKCAVATAYLLSHRVLQSVGIDGGVATHIGVESIKLAPVKRDTVGWTAIGYAMDKIVGIDGCEAVARGEGVDMTVDFAYPYFCLPT